MAISGIITFAFKKTVMLEMYLFSIYTKITVNFKTFSVLPPKSIATFMMHVATLLWIFSANILNLSDIL